MPSAFHSYSSHLESSRSACPYFTITIYSHLLAAMCTTIFLRERTNFSVYQSNTGFQLSAIVLHKSLELHEKSCCFIPSPPFSEFAYPLIHSTLRILGLIPELQEKDPNRGIQSCRFERLLFVLFLFFLCTVS